MLHILPLRRSDAGFPASSRDRRRSLVGGVTLDLAIVAILAIQSENASAACAATGTNPVTLTCAASTTTTNTSNTVSPNPATSDRTQDFNASILGQVNGGVTVDGFGLSLITTLPGSTVSVTNNGAITTNQPGGISALQVSPGAAGNFGTFSYSGSGNRQDRPEYLRLKRYSERTAGLGHTLAHGSDVSAERLGLRLR